MSEDKTTIAELPAGYQLTRHRLNKLLEIWNDYGPLIQKPIPLDVLKRMEAMGWLDEPLKIMAPFEDKSENCITSISVGDSDDLEAFDPDIVVTVNIRFPKTWEQVIEEKSR